MAFSLHCRTCGLELDNPVELRAAGMPASWTHRDPGLMSAFRERDAVLAEYADHDDADVEGYEDTDS
jgi:hypothetical protein